MIDVCFGFAAGLSVVREQQSRRLVNSMSVPSRQHAGNMEEHLRLAHHAWLYQAKFLVDENKV